MAASGNSSLTALLKKTVLDDHEELLNASEAALKTSKNDTEAQHIKAVALLKLDKYEEAVKFFNSVGESLKSKARLEYAYALYKSGRLQDAAQAASEIEDNRGAQHVEAQARYRLEDFTRTAQIYKEIRKQATPGEEADLRINQGAIDAQGQWLGLLDPALVKKTAREDLEAFETCYNAACGSVARGELAQAEILLKRAKELCKHSEDLSEDQRKEELLPIAIQQTYVLHRQGKTAEAEAISKEITVDDVADLSTRKIASVNLILSSSLQENPFLMHKTLNSTPKIPESDKLFSYQSIPLASNEKTIDLKSFKFNGLAQNTRKRLSKLPPSSTSSEALLLSAFNAAALAQNEVGKAAVNNVLPELERRPNDIGLILTIVQMYTLIGNTTSAIELIENLFKRLESATAENEQAVRYHPGLVSILINLYKLQGRKLQIKQELAKAAAYWRQNPEPPVTLLRAAGVSLLQSSSSSDIDAAAEIFSKLYDQQPDDKATIAGYIASHALSKSSSVQSMAEKLTSVSKLISNIDTDALENQGIPQSTNALAIAQAQSGGKSRKRAAPADADGKNKRIRKSRLPKNFDPGSNSKPDPERWLPMRDRSYYRAPKGKKKGRKGDDRTQGGAINEDLDVSKQSQSKGGEIVTASSGGGGKKKKGKGKK